MSRNAPFRTNRWRVGPQLFWLLVPGVLWAQKPDLDLLPLKNAPPDQGRVVIVHDPQATTAFKPVPAVIGRMLDRGLITLTGKNTATLAWTSLFSTQDVVGLKVFSLPGPNSGTRPALVEAVVQGLLEAGLPPGRIVIWDKHLASLREAGFVELAARHGVQVAGSVEAGYDPTRFYERPLLGQLAYTDLEFGRTEEGMGRKSYFSKLLTGRITKLIVISPLLNHNRAGVTGIFYSLSLASVDNTIRFETAPDGLVEAVPDIFSELSFTHPVVLSMVDALICQYEGEQRSLLHYATVLNELRLSTDPVALDVLSLRELEKQRRAAGIAARTNSLEMFDNAALLQLGVSSPRQIRVERLP